MKYMKNHKNMKILVVVVFHIQCVSLLVLNLKNDQVNINLVVETNLLRILKIIFFENTIFVKIFNTPNIQFNLL